MNDVSLSEDYRHAVNPPGGGMPPGGMPPGGMPPGGMPPGGMPPGGMPPGGMPPGGMPPGGMPPGGMPPGGMPPGGVGFAGAPPAGSGPTFNPGEAVSFGFRAMTSDYAALALPIAVGVFIAELPGSIVSAIVGGVLGILRDSGSMGHGLASLAEFVTMPITWFVGLVSHAFMMGGIVRFVLEATRGHKPDFAVIFSGMPYFGPMFISSLISSIGILIGLALCVVPGVILALGWAFYQFALVDKNLGAVEALKASWDMTSGQRVTLFVLFLIFLAIALTGLLMCGIGVFLFSAPIALFSMAYVYRKLQSQEAVLP